MKGGYILYYNQHGSWLYKTALPESGATTRWGIPRLLAEGSCSSSPMKREAHAVPVGSVMGVCHQP